MKVLILGLNYRPEPTGIAPYTAGMADGLAQRGHFVRVLTTHPHYPAWKLPAAAPWRAHEQHGTVSVTRVRHYVPGNPRSQIKRAWSEVSFGARALGGSWGSPDVVVCPSPALLSTAIVLGRNRLRDHAAFGVVVHDLYSAGVSEANSGGGAATRALSAFEGKVVRSADGVAVIHERFKERLVQTLGARPDRVTVVRNWTHVQQASPFDRAAFRHRIGWGLDEVVVLHSGAMGEKQALSNVVMAARVAAERKLPLKFVLLGGGGQRSMLEALGRGLANLQFLDPLPGDDYSKALASADVLLVNEKPGVLEMAIPSKLTSYFSASRPVVAASEPASITASEVLGAGAGIVVSPGNPSAIVTAVLRLSEDPRRSAEMGARGRIYCETHLSEVAALDAYEAWIQELYERKRAGDK